MNINKILDEIERAYPEDIFPDTTQEERNTITTFYPGFVDRTSAAMGRHFAKVVRRKLEEQDEDEREIMRDYKNTELYLNQLAGDIYAQPEGGDEHGALAKQIIDQWMSLMTTCKSVLDLGAGEGFCQPLFEWWNVSYEGVCLGQDFVVALEKGRNVKKMDFSFLDYPDKSFDLLFARHSLEHSPMPLLTLMEWERVSRYWLGLIMPAPEWYTFFGDNHYSVMTREQIENLTDRAGWKVLWNDTHYRDKESVGLIPHEYRYMFEKKGI